MKLRPSDLVLSTAHNRVTAAQASRRALVPIVRSTYVSVRALGAAGPTWASRLRVAESRLLATQARTPDGCEVAFTGESALISLGLQPWWNNPDVSLRRRTRSGHKRYFPAVTLPNSRVPEVLLKQTSTHTRTLADTRISVGGIPIAPLSMVILDLARDYHPLQAFHDISVLIRHHSRFDRFDLRASRGRAKALKTQLKAEMGELSVRENHGSAETVRRIHALTRSFEILAAADPGIESPAESIPLWALKCVLRRGVKVETQHPFQMAGGQRYADIALPQHRVAIEISGMGKFGDSSVSAHSVATAALARQQDLEDSGWRVINLTYDQVRRPLALIDSLGRSLARSGVVVRPPRGPLWREPTPLLFAQSRRF